jgi:hypothetical protein
VLFEMFTATKKKIEAEWVLYHFVINLNGLNL